MCLKVFTFSISSIYLILFYNNVIFLFQTKEKQEKDASVDNVEIKSEYGLASGNTDTIEDKGNDIKSNNENTANKDQQHNNQNKPIPKKEKTLYSCPVCKAVLDHKKRLHFHLRKHIAEPVCYLCKKRLAKMECLEAHLRRIHGQGLFDMKPEHATAMPKPVSTFVTYMEHFLHICTSYTKSHLQYLFSHFESRMLPGDSLCISTQSSLHSKSSICLP